MSASANRVTAKSRGNEHDRVLQELFSFGDKLLFRCTGLGLICSENIRMSKINSGSVVEWLVSTSLYLTLLQT